MFQHDNKHYGKAMIKQEGNMISIIMDCETCGRFVVGPLDAIHTRSVASMLDMVGKQLGLGRGRHTEVGHMSSDDPHVLEEGERLFEKMGMSDAEHQKLGLDAEVPPTIDNPWSKKRSA